MSFKALKAVFAVSIILAAGLARAQESSLDMDVYQSKEIILAEVLSKAQPLDKGHAIKTARVLKGRRLPWENILVYFDGAQEFPAPGKKAIFFIGSDAMSDVQNSYYHVIRIEPVEKEKEIAAALAQQQKIMRSGSSEDSTLQKFIDKIYQALNSDDLSAFKGMSKSFQLDGRPVDDNDMRSLFNELKRINRLYDYKKVYKAAFKAQRYPVYKGTFSLGGHDYDYTIINLKRGENGWFIDSVTHCN